LATGAERVAVQPHDAALCAQERCSGREVEPTAGDEGTPAGAVTGAIGFVSSFVMPIIGESVEEVACTSSRRPIVLVVDDDSDTRKIFERFLIRDFNILSVASALECLETLDRERVDLILLDLLMPEIDGLTLLQRIRDTSATARIPVIVVTVWDHGASMRKAKTLGVKEYLIKPVVRRQLLRSVKSHISQVPSP
jgi:PleD family two-component response regulator